MKFRELLNLILTHRKKIFSITFLGTVIYILLLYFVYPLTYSSLVTILPPETKQSGGLSSLLQATDLTNLLSVSSGANSQLYAEIIKSRSSCEYVIKKLNLIQFYDVKSVEQAVQKLSSDLAVEVTKEGIIKINVPVSTIWFGRFSSNNDTIKKYSMLISNFFAEALDKINREKLSSKAKKARLYIEEQISITKVKLDSVESVLMDFQKENKTISLPEQLKVSIETAAKLKSEIITTEINIGMFSRNMNENNQSILSLKSKLDELKEQYNKLESTNQDFLLSFKEAPELGLKLANLFRDVKILNEVYLLLQQQFYKEKIQENRDLPTVEILDKAVVPEKPTSPRLVYSSVLGCIFIFLTISLVVVISEKKVLKYK